MKGRSVSILVVLVLGGFAPPGSAQTGADAVVGVTAKAPTAEQLVARAGEYVAGFVKRFSNVVAEEPAEQRSRLDRRTRTIVSGFRWSRSRARTRS